MRTVLNDCAAAVGPIRFEPNETPITARPWVEGYRIARSTMDERSNHSILAMAITNLSRCWPLSGSGKLQAIKSSVDRARALRITCDARIAEVTTGDRVLVPALDPDVLAHLEAHRAVVSWLRRMAEDGAEIASACTGTFLLGEAGLLEVGERRELRGERLAREPRAGTASQRRQGSAPGTLMAGYSRWAAVGVAA